MTPVSLLGLGAMGAPMAEQLLAAGHELTVWNRTPQRREPFLGRARIAAVPAEAAADIVVTVTTDLDGVTAVLEGPEGLLEGWGRSGITDPVLLVMGTVSPRAVAQLAGRLAAHGVHLLDAPVSGGVVGARAGTLSIMVGGDAAIVDRVTPVLAVMGATIRHMGPVGSGALAKLCNQLIVAAGVTAISEAMLLARRSGLDLPALTDILEGGLAGSEILRQKGANWIDEEFVAGGSARNQLKDLRFAQSAIADAGLVLPLTGTVTQLFDDLVAAGGGNLDHTGIYREIERRSAVDSATTQGESMSDHVVVTAVFIPKEGKRQPVLDALEVAIPLVHDEEGCELYAIQEAPDGTIFMIEKWTSAELLDAHGAGEPVAQLNRALEGLLERPVEVTRLVALPVGDARKGAL